MSAIANLISLEGIRFLDREGRGDSPIDIVVSVDDGQLRGEQTGLLKGVKIVFDIFPKIQRMSFDKQVKIRISVEDTFAGTQTDVGTVFIVPGEAGLGERTQHFTGAGVDYVLHYKVVAA